MADVRTRTGRAHFLGAFAQRERGEKARQKENDTGTAGLVNKNRSPCEQDQLKKATVPLKHSRISDAANGNLTRWRMNAVIIRRKKTRSAA